MDFSFDDNQQMLHDSVDRFLTEKHDLAARAKLLNDRAAQDQLWKEMAELGWIGAAFPEEVGGYGSSPVDAMVVLERMGRHLVTAPYLMTAILCGRLLVDGLAGERREQLIGEIIAGDCRMALAAGGSHALRSPEHASFTMSDGVINGRAPVVLGGDVADKLLIAARSSGAHGDAEGISLYLVNADAAGVSRRYYRMLDGQGAAELVLEGVQISADALVGEADRAAALINKAFDHAIAGICAEAVGAMDHLVTATAEYTKTREQYGAPLAKFQVLQHRMADMYIQTEMARSMAYVASMSLDESDAKREAIMSAAKVQIGRTGKFTGYQAVQLHGGMGMAEELDIGHHYVRLTCIAQLFGGHSYHLGRFAGHTRSADALSL